MKTDRRDHVKATEEATGKDDLVLLRSKCVTYFEQDCVCMCAYIQLKLY